MRMRRKKNLEEKLLQCPNLMDFPKVDKDVREMCADKEYIDLEAYFGNKNPVCLEVGCGKGTFVCTLAKRNPDKNYIAVELNKSIVLMACRKAIDEGIKNVLFLHLPAEILVKYLQANSIERVYLNFSTPFPGKPNATKRLTNPKFINQYKELLTKDGEIHQKTDNMGLFEYSLEQFSQQGMALKEVSLDLHANEPEDNIVTEYEQKFVSQGLPIYRLVAYIND